LEPEEEEEGDAVAKDHESPEATVTLKVRPGHDNAMTIVACGLTSKDRSQILLITPSMCREGLTPRRVCEAIIEEMEASEHMATYSPPVAKASWLPALREYARLLKPEPP